MSLINDALKRASQAQKDKGSPPAAGPEMKPAQSSEKSRSLTVIILSVVLIAAAGLAAWFFFGTSGNRGASPAHRPSVVTTTNAAARITNAASKLVNTLTNKLAPITASSIRAVTQAAVQVSATISTNLPALSRTQTNSAVVRPSTNPPPVAIASQPVQPVSQLQPAKPALQAQPAQPTKPSQPALPFPSLKLKGIIYNETSPQVLINGSTYSLGEEVDGARVVKIERKKVTVKWNGENRELLLE